jgi:hypothetical protein
MTKQLRKRVAPNADSRELAPAHWNKEQAELLRHIALDGGSCAADKCQGLALDALMAVGFMRHSGDCAVLTEAGLARARELRPSSRLQSPRKPSNPPSKLRR